MAQFCHFVSFAKWQSVFKLSCSGFESRCSHLRFRSLQSLKVQVRYHPCFQQGVPRHLGHCRVQPHLEGVFDMMEIYNQLHQVLKIQFCLGSFPKCLSVHLRTKWWWVQIPLKSDSPSVSSKKLIDIQAITNRRLTLNMYLP